MKRFVFALVAVLFVLGRAPGEAAVVEVDASALGTALDGFVFQVPLAEAIESAPGTYVFTGLSGDVTLDGAISAVTGGTLTASGSAFTFSLPGDIGGVTGLTLTLFGATPIPAGNLEAALLAIRSVTFGFAGYVEDGAPVSGFGAVTTSASIPLPPAALLFAAGAVLLRPRRGGAPR